MTDISREAVEAAKIWLSRMNDCVLSRCDDCDGSERGISGLLDALLDRKEKLERDNRKATKLSVARLSRIQMITKAVNKAMLLIHFDETPAGDYHKGMDILDNIRRNEWDKVEAAPKALEE
uniref:Uncharacterized protein n=1 Tax=viral metagenome TaxID=1070528 RepID=A0A6H1ZJV3_9ZZZZ